MPLLSRLANLECHFKGFSSSTGIIKQNHRTLLVLIRELQNFSLQLGNPDLSLQAIGTQTCKPTA